MQPKPFRYDSVKQRKNKLQIQYSQPLQLQYSSQPRQPQGNFQVQEVGKDDQNLIQNYTEMLNQENDIYYLFDCFHQLLNALKQAQNEIEVSSKKITQTTSSRHNTLDWWKVTGSSSAWTGMKNIKPLGESQLKQSSSRFMDSYNSKASAIIDGLKRQIGELTDEQKFKQNCRLIGNVAIPIFNEQDLEYDLRKQGRILLTIFQLQNRYHKCHMGFGLVQLIETEGDREILIHKMYIAKCYRKSNNYNILVSELLRYIVLQMNANRVKIKINSSQVGLIRHLQGIGFKLSAQLPVINDLKILTLLLHKKDYKQHQQQHQQQ